MAYYIRYLLRVSAMNCSKQRVYHIIPLSELSEVGVMSRVPGMLHVSSNGCRFSVAQLWNKDIYRLHPHEKNSCFAVLSPFEKSQYASGHHDLEDTQVMVMSGKLGARSESSFNFPHGCRHRLVQVLKTETKQTKPDLALWVKERLILGDLVLVHKMVCRSENTHGRGKDSWLLGRV